MHLCTIALVHSKTRLRACHFFRSFIKYPSLEISGEIHLFGSELWLEDVENMTKIVASEYST